MLIKKKITIGILIGLILAVVWPLIAKAVLTPEPTPIEPSTPLPEAASAVVPAVLERIAQCESHNIANAKNPNSTASGRFQFLKSSWEGYGKELWGSIEGKDVFSAKDNTELALYVYRRYGTSPWNASRYCWE